MSIPLRHPDEPLCPCSPASRILLAFFLDATFFYCIFPRCTRWSNHGLQRHVEALGELFPIGGAAVFARLLCPAVVIHSFLLLNGLTRVLALAM